MNASSPTPTTPSASTDQPSFDAKVLRKTVLDYIHPFDFYSLVNAILAAPAANAVVDAYSKAPIDKPTLMAVMQEMFGLQYEAVQTGAGVNARGGKPYYCSLNRRAEGFGYLPALTSLQGVLEEAAHALHLHPNE